MRGVIVKSVFTGNIKNGSGDLEELICIKLWNGKIWSLGMDSYLKCWSTDLQNISTHFMKIQYAITFNCDENNLYLGTGNGQIIIYDKNIHPLKIIKIGQHIISKIQITQKNIYIISYNGSFVIIDKQSHEIIKVIQFGIQLYDICLYKQSIYVAGPKTFRINLDYTYEEIIRANKFLIFKDEIYGINHTDGLYSINSSFFKCWPSQVVSTHDNYIISLFDEGIAIFNQDQIGCHWASNLIPQFNSGYAPTDIISLGNNEFISCCQNGKLYKIKVIKCQT